jgi:hypothetical protein
MEKNKLSLQLSRIALKITLVIWFLALTVFLASTFVLFPMFLLYLVPTIFNIIIAYEKNHKKSNSLAGILATLFSYIGFGMISISMYPSYLADIIFILFIPQTILLILACKIEKKSLYN